tara:strand:- start:1224 stop:3167 length:1944 start_codon:yes stop_codon:yes gene_type:complete
LKKNTAYQSKDIEVLQGLEPVRKRPGMYIGSTDEYGLHHLVNEIIDNSIDEILSKSAKNISIKLSKNNLITIKDDGRGIPTEPHPKFKKKSALEVVLTTLHAGGKFNDKIYTTAGGLHGVGLSVVNALSENLEVKVFRKGYEFSQKYKKGKPKTKIKKIKCNKNTKGTEISFQPDPDIFDATNFDPKKIYTIVKTKSYLIKGANFLWECDKSLIKDIKIPNKESFCFPNGIKDYLLDIANNKKKLIDKNFYDEIINQELSIRLEIAISFNEDENGKIYTFCNSINTNLGGTHESAIKSAIIKSIKLYSRHNKIPKIANINLSDIFDYSDTILSLYVSNPIFEGQTKQKLFMPKIHANLEKIIIESFSHWLSTNNRQTKKLIEVLIERSLLRSNLTKIKDLERKTTIEKHRLPGKLVDCSSRKIQGTELFIVEGDSAGGSAKQARNRELQAVLPLRGKILNVYNVSITKISENQEIQNLIQSLGCGIGKNFDINKLRYEKIVLMTDADVDGSHIATLIITFFYKFMPKIIYDGKLFLAIPPLYKISKNDKIFYAYSEKDKKKIINEKFNKNENFQITRFKGLGEMPALQLKETTMSQDRRTLLKIIMDNNKKNIKKTDILMQSLMGKKPELRFKFIQDKANFVNNIDY